MFPLPANVQCHFQAINFAEEPMTEPLHTWLKEVFSSICWLGVPEKTVKAMGQREASLNFL